MLLLSDWTTWFLTFVRLWICEDWIFFLVFNRAHDICIDAIADQFLSWPISLAGETLMISWCHWENISPSKETLEANQLDRWLVSLALCYLHAHFLFFSFSVLFKCVHLGRVNWSSDLGRVNRQRINDLRHSTQKIQINMFCSVLTYSVDTKIVFLH